MVEMKLSERGYRRGDLNSAGMAIFIAYGINSAGVRDYAYSLPVYGTNTFSGSSFGSGGMTNFSGTTSGVVGSHTVAGSMKEYTKDTNSRCSRLHPLQEYWPNCLIVEGRHHEHRIVK
jgi:hypothetical protein